MKKTAETNVIVRPRTPQIVPQDGQRFALMQSPEEMNRALRLIDANLAGQTFSPLDLARIKAPAGGNSSLQVDGASGPAPAQDLEGIVVAFRQTRVYWAEAYGSGGAQRPSCSSRDGFRGVGKPGGICADCPLKEFGTIPNPLTGGYGAGKACRDQRELLILLGDSPLPHILVLPPTSIKNWMNYALKLIYEKTEFWQVVTRIFTEPSTSQGGVKYYRVNFKMKPGSKLSPEQARQLEPYHEKMRALLTPMTVDVTARDPQEPGGRTETSTETEEEVPF